MTNVLVTGAFGQGNPGDEALCAVVCNSLHGHDIVVGSRDPAETTRRHRVTAIASSHASMIRAARRADVIVVAGGTIFKSLHPTSGRRPGSLLVNTSAMLAAAKVRGTAVAMVGVGADDLTSRSTRAMASWVVRHTDLMILRDEESAAVLAKAGAPGPFWVGADLAWAQAQEIGTVQPLGKRRPTITVALSHLAGDERMVRNLATALAPLAERFVIQLQPWQVGGSDQDTRLAERIRALMLGDSSQQTGSPSIRIVDAPVGLLDAAASMAGNDLVVALRFHAILAAALAGVPSMAISHEPKLAGLSRRLRQLAVPAHSSSDVLSAAVRHSLAGQPATAEVIRSEMLAAEQSIDLLRMLADRGAIDHPADTLAMSLTHGGGNW